MAAVELELTPCLPACHGFPFRLSFDITTLSLSLPA